MDEEQLLNFAQITGSDLDTARHFMEAANWQLDQAVELFFTNPTAPPTRTDTRSQSHQDTFGSFDASMHSGRNLGVMEEDVRKPMEQHVSRLFGEENDPQPITGRGGFSTNLPSFLTERLPGLFGQRRPQERIQSPQNELTKGSDQFRKMFAPPKKLIFNGSFQAAQNEAGTEKKWLLINIQADDIFDCHRLNRDTWGNEMVSTIVSAFFVFWQVDKSTGEGARFTSLYHVQDFPYIAIIDPRTGENMKHWVGFINPQKMCDELQKFTDSNSLDDGFMPAPIQEIDNTPQPFMKNIPSYQPPFTHQPSNYQQDLGNMVDDDDYAEDQLLRQAIAESLKGNEPFSGGVQTTTTREKTEDELLQEAIQASLEGHQMQDDEDEILKQIQEQSQREHEELLQRQKAKEEEEEQKKKQQRTPDIPFLNKVNQYVIGDQDKTTDSSLVTRLQLRLPNGKREVVKLLKATPLTIIYALVRNKLAADVEGNDILQVPPFTIVNVNKPLENTADKTLLDANALGSSLMVTFD